MHVFIVVGSRPEAIKLAPVIAALKADLLAFRVTVCSTGQQRDLIAPTLADFGLTPSFDLNVMRQDPSLAGLTVRLVSALDEALAAFGPDCVLVQGDTTSAMAGALAAFYRRIPVGHVEAGLRSDDRHAPFPEEVNRRIITACADLHFAPTVRCVTRLLQEGVQPASVFLTGNTVVDAMLSMRERSKSEPSALPIELMARIRNRRMLLTTVHRRENWGKGIASICDALLAIVAEVPDLVAVWPVHPNPSVRDTVTLRLGGHPSIVLTPPQSYRALVELLDRAYLVLTDSGGIQEEAPSFGKPVLVLRDRTERPEGVDAGVAEIVGTDPARVIAEVCRLTLQPDAYRRMASAQNPYGDGQSAARIRAALLRSIATQPAMDRVPQLARKVGRT
jgi:UDP-N-acetylglucosamine 2-epimerase (non-hydrolysing)